MTTLNNNLDHDSKKDGADDVNKSPVVKALLNHFNQYDIKPGKEITDDNEFQYIKLNCDNEVQE